MQCTNENELSMRFGGQYPHYLKRFKSVFLSKKLIKCYVLRDKIISTTTEVKTSFSVSFKVRKSGKKVVFDVHVFFKENFPTLDEGASLFT